MPISLTDRQERFAFETLFNMDAAGAARRAGYPAASAATQASELMQQPAMRERIRIETASVLAQLHASPLDLIRERIKAAFFRAEKLFDAAGKVLPIREMEESTREALQASVELRRGEAVIRLRQPNRETALAVLEKMHLRREQASERYYEKLEREAKAAARVPVTTRASPSVPDGPPPLNDWERLQLEKAQRAAARSEAIDPEKPNAIFSEKHQVLYGSDHICETPAGEIPEKDQVLSGSAPDKPPILSKFTEAMKRLRAKREPKAEKKEVPKDGYNFRDDPHWMWGGRRKPTPEPEPHPLAIRAMQDAKRKEHHDELIGALRKNGKVMIGGREQLHVPGYNPPWLRGRQEAYAVGKGEGIFEHYRDGEG